ncbi:MAG: carboxypeptidase-like regulatory domain-containing protein, partial [Acidobacteriaceae bacterium]
MTRRFMKLCVLLLCGVFAVATFAQNTNSTITGTVEDSHGAVVPGAAITLTNAGTNQQFTTTSQANGFYNFTNLSPANYKVSVSAPGFAEWVGVLTLRVSQAASINAQLTAASVSTKVTVRDVTPVIDRVNPTISDVKNATTIETLPVQGRKIINILAFSPGVVAGNYGGSGAGFTRVNGIPGGSLSFLVDGQTAANRFS